MALILPPPPIGEPQDGFAWQQWFLALNAIYTGTGTVPWALIDTAGSNITDIATRVHANLQSLQGGTTGEYYHLTSAQHTDLTDAGDSTLHFHSADRARANHTGTQVMSTISDLPTLAAGTYTPTRSAEANLDAIATMTEAQYMRVGATVTVSGRFTADPTAGGAASFEITLPVASNIGAVEDVAGVAFCGAIAGQGAEIIGVIANDTAKIQWVASDVTSQTWSYTFSYQVI